MARSRVSVPSLEPCYFQEKLPPELRNEIYALVFTTDNFTYWRGAEPAMVDLSDAKPPSKSLTLTCRQIHIESHGIYRSAFQSFWKGSSFTISSRFLSPVTMSRLREQDLQHITKLKIKMWGPSYKDTLYTFELLSVDGAWHWADIDDVDVFPPEHKYCVLGLTPGGIPGYKVLTSASEVVRKSASLRKKASMKQQLIALGQLIRSHEP